jgi:hypothetical protein
MHQNISLGSNVVDMVRSSWKITTWLRGINFCNNCKHYVSCSHEMVPNAPKHYRTHQNMSLTYNGVNRVRSFEKLWHDFVTQTFALISPFHPVLHQVSCNDEMIPNARKHYETHQNISLRLYGMNRMHSLRIILPRLLGTNYCIICTSSARFAPSFMQYWNDHKCTQTLQTTPEDVFKVQWGELGAFVAKNSDINSLHKLLH